MSIEGEEDEKEERDRPATDESCEPEYCQIDQKKVT
jgi:hypothetical protein